MKKTAATDLNTGSSQSIQSKGLSLDWIGLVSGLPVPADALLTKALHYTVVVPDVIVCPLVSNLPSLPVCIQCIHTHVDFGGGPAPFTITTLCREPAAFPAEMPAASTESTAV